MRIVFRKLSDERHALEIVRPSRDVDGIECETRSYLVHDLLHFAVETEAGVQSGVWGSLARGKTLADLNDRTGEAMKSLDGKYARDLADIEQIVGALHGSVKGGDAAELVAGIRRFAAALGGTLPRWFDEAFVVAVQEKMRRLLGRWKATPYGGVMDLDWPEA